MAKRSKLDPYSQRRVISRVFREIEAAPTKAPTSRGTAVRDFLKKQEEFLEDVRTTPEDISYGICPFVTYLMWLTGDTQEPNFDWTPDDGSVNVAVDNPAAVSGDDLEFTLQSPAVVRYLTDFDEARHEAEAANVLAYIRELYELIPCYAPIDALDGGDVDREEEPEYPAEKYVTVTISNSEGDAVTLRQEYSEDTDGVVTPGTVSTTVNGAAVILDVATARMQAILAPVENELNNLGF